MESDSSVELGQRAKRIRTKRGLRIADVAATSGLASSTISKVENGQMALTYDKLLQLARGLGVDLVDLLREGEDVAVKAAPTAFQGRRAITLDGSGQYISTDWYEYWYLNTDLSSKDMIPILGMTKARSIEQFGSLIRHGGQEFVYVISGILIIHTELYSPTTLKIGDSMYFDSSMGHAYIAGSDEECRFLIVCSDATVSEEAARILHRPSWS